MIDIASIFDPFEDHEVLVENERVFYKRRRHWAVLMPGFFESAALLYFWAILAYPVPRPLFPFAFVGFFVSGYIIFRWTERIPLERRIIAILFIAALVVGFFLGVPIATVVGIVAAIRIYQLAMQMIRWRWYRRLYITNRRLIETDGLIGRKINVMPLRRITDATLDFSATGQVLDYGLFRAESAGQKQALGRINYLRDAVLFYDIVMRMAAQPIDTDGFEIPEYASAEPEDIERMQRMRQPEPEVDPYAPPSDEQWERPFDDGGW